MTRQEGEKETMFFDELKEKDMEAALAVDEIFFWMMPKPLGEGTTKEEFEEFLKKGDEALKATDEIAKKILDNK